MQLVEIWTIGGKDSESFVIIRPLYKDVNGATGYVINGDYKVIRHKKSNKLTILNVPSNNIVDGKLGKRTYKNEVHTSFYLGDIEHRGNYNETIQKYEDTRKVKGRNLIKVKKPEKFVESDEPCF
jgi:hypothetical protein